MNCKLEIEYQIDMETGNSKYIVTTTDNEYKDVIGKGTTVNEAIMDFDTKCEKAKKCA